MAINLADFLSGRRVLETVRSDYNGELKVIEDLAWGRHVMGGGVTQSGGVAKKVWKTSLEEIKNYKFEIKNCLILGLGAGSIANLVRQYWPESKITGVDIDPVMVKLGKKYFNLERDDVDIHISDANEYLQKQLANTQQLICIDLYKGQGVPKKFDMQKFVALVKSKLENSGVAIFNRLYSDNKQAEAFRFEKKLKKEFRSVIRVYPEANIMFICQQ